MAPTTLLGGVICAPTHPDLKRLTTLDDVMLVPMAIAPITLHLICSDTCMLAIKYVSVSDLLQSIRTDRLTSDMVRLKAASEWAYLILGGQLTAGNDSKAYYDNTRTGWEWSAVQGALLSVQEQGIAVTSVKHPDDVPALLSRLIARQRSPKRTRPAREALFYSEAEDMLMALPGIGEDKAMALIQQCGSAAWALAALTDDRTDLPGIGAATRATIRTALGLSPTTALIPIALEDLT